MKRLKSLQTASPHKLLLAFAVPVESSTAFALERRLHAFLESLPMVSRLRGEWFSVEPRKWALPLETYVFTLIAGEPRSEDQHKDKNVAELSAAIQRAGGAR